jgi:6-phosphofructokinase 1
VRDSNLDFTIQRLGDCRSSSPMAGGRFMHDDERVLYHARLEKLKPWITAGQDPPAMDAAGPGEKLFFELSKLACGIVT